MFEGLRFAWSYTAPAGRGWRFHQAVRVLCMPFDSLMEQLPGEGRLLDFGCGHGLFLAMARRARPRLEVRGVDASSEKIELARACWRASFGEEPPISAETRPEFPESSFDAITVIDVFYLLPIAEWDRLLAGFHRGLKPGGVLLFKEMNRARRWKFPLIRLQETLAVKVLGWTLGSDFSFPGPEEIRGRLEKAGFRVEDSRLDRWNYLPHHLWLARR